MKNRETFNARLTGNKRGVGTTTPKVLLINIEPNDVLEREHAWIDITKDIQKIMPKGHQKPRKIEFTATLKKYLKRGTEYKYTLEDIEITKA